MSPCYHAVKNVAKRAGDSLLIPRPAGRREVKVTLKGEDLSVEILADCAAFYKIGKCKKIRIGAPKNCNEPYGINTTGIVLIQHHTFDFVNEGHKIW